MKGAANKIHNVFSTEITVGQSVPVRLLDVRRDLRAGGAAGLFSLLGRP